MRARWESVASCSGTLSAAATVRRLRLSPGLPRRLRRQPSPIEHTEKRMSPRQWSAAARPYKRSLKGSLATTSPMGSMARKAHTDVCEARPHVAREGWAGGDGCQRRLELSSRTACSGRTSLGSPIGHYGAAQAGPLEALKLKLSDCRASSMSMMAVGAMPAKWNRYCQDKAVGSSRSQRGMAPTRYLTAVPELSAVTSGHGCRQRCSCCAPTRALKNREGVNGAGLRVPRRHARQVEHVPNRESKLHVRSPIPQPFGFHGH
jgi:hypothetical protein